MFLRGIVEELLFFIRGETDSKILENKNVNIWKGNTDRKFLDSVGMEDRKEGIMGPLYGYQWRHFNADYDENNTTPLDKGIDQLQNVIDTIKRDPSSRRILLTSYNPCQSKQGVLYPCHSIIIQFYVSEEFLDMYCYNRSQDLFLGVPFNIASSSLLLLLIAKVVNLTPRYLNIGMGDIHIYKQHYEAVETQLDRLPYRFPKIEIKDVKSLKDIENLKYEDFILIDYLHYPVIKSEMIA
jgi:thymidylate synthase